MKNDLKEKRIEKLKKIKALAERGIGGEKEGAIKLYNELLAKYELSESEINEDKIERRWVRFKSYVDQRLIAQLFYKVTGDRTHYEKVDKRRNLVGFECTEFEYQEFLFYYNFYTEHLQNELDVFLGAFIVANQLFPDSNARVKVNDDTDIEELSSEEMEMRSKMIDMAEDIEAKSPLKEIDVKED